MAAPLNRSTAVWTRVRATRPSDRAGIAVVAVVVLVSAGFVVAAWIHPAAPDSQAELDDAHEALDAADPWEPRDAAGDEGVVKVLEHGFSRIEDTDSDYALGFVLHNTSRTDAVMPEIGLTVLDADGDEVDADVHGGLENGLLPPGGRVGVADTVHLSKPVAERMTLTVDTARWYPARADIGDITATNIRGDFGTGLRVDIESEYDTALLEPSFHVLFRAPDGELLGGQLADPDSPRPGVPPGDSSHELELPAAMPEGTDPDNIGLYVGYDQTIVAF